MYLPPVAPLETIGMFGFAWTSLGPDYGIPWIAPLIFVVMVGMANYAIYKVGLHMLGFVRMFADSSDRVQSTI